MSQLDFSLPMLKTLLGTIKSSGYQILRFQDFWDRQDDVAKTVLFRHDVDRFPTTALETARAEARLGIRGTYFFRVKPGVFVPQLIREIHSLGHEIGYHYECLADTKGDYELAFSQFTENLRKLRELAPVVSASMHSRPFSSHDSRTMWDKRPLQEFGILGECYRTVDHNRYLYLADSGRNWSGSRNVVWDTVNGLVAPQISGTVELCELIRSGKHPHIQLLIHPNRWSNGMFAWASQFAMDHGINFVKTCIKLRKSLRTSA